uniref:C-type lectin domain-containing protein n=1 Tax=Caenorhabditis japonica TaxID=281687 RepID=A0A8R1DM07_CAEJA
MARLQCFLYSVFLVSTVLSFGVPIGGDDCEEEGQLKCPPGYKLFERENQRAWCMKYFPGNVTFFEAERTCRCQGGGSLSGIENTNELNWILKQSEIAFSDVDADNGGVWLGAYRRTDCHGPVANWINKTECNKANQFQWTDRHTLKKEDIWARWMEGAPHNNVIGKHSENCVHLQVSLEAIGTPNRKLSGTFDNKVCTDLGTESTFITRGFVCGRPPKGGSGNGGGYSGGGSDFVVIGAGAPEKKP